MKTYRLIALKCFLALISQGNASELMQTPYQTPYLELQPQLQYRYEGFDNFRLNRRDFSYRAHNHFLTASIASAYKEYSGEAEIEAAKTHRFPFHFDRLSLYGRKQLLDDILTDPVTLTIGVKGSFTSAQALKDPSSFHHGYIDVEMHTFVAKEFSTFKSWKERIWINSALGMAERGAPWLRADLYYARNFCDQSQFDLFLQTLWGFGRHSLKPWHFNGYGPVRHRSIDVGMRFSKFFDQQGSLHFEYVRRLYAKNFSLNTNIFKISYLYPFGL